MMDIKGEIISAIPSMIVAILGIIFVIYLMMGKYKKSRKTQEKFKQQLEVKHRYSGNILIVDNILIYSRGNSSVSIMLTNSDELTLTKDDVLEWFDEKRYNETDADRILNDIKYYLESNKKYKYVSIK